jgi:hypothetical protein
LKGEINLRLIKNACHAMQPLKLFKLSYCCYVKCINLANLNNFFLKNRVLQRDHGRRRVSGSRPSSAGIHPITAWHTNFTTKARIIAMITLTLNKLAR